MNPVDLLQAPLFRNALLAALAGGAGCATLGALIVGLGMPFIGVAAAHGAMAGAVGALLVGLPLPAGAFVGACLAVWGIGPLVARTRMEHELAVGIIFSTMLGFTFMGMSRISGDITPLLGLLWGNILLLPTSRLLPMLSAGVATLLFVALFFPGIRALLVSPKLAAASGLRTGLLTALILSLTGITVAVYLEALGGLLIFAVLVTPAATARLVCRSLRGVIAASAALGGMGCLGGLLLAAWWNTGAGATIIVLLCGVFFLTLILTRRRITVHDP